MDSVMMADNGRLVVPASLRQQIGMAKGGKLIASIQNGALVLEPFDAAVRRVQALARQLAKPGDSVVDEFLSDRRDEARQDGDG